MNISIIDNIGSWTSMDKWGPLVALAWFHARVLYFGSKASLSEFAPSLRGFTAPVR